MSFFTTPSNGTFGRNPQQVIAATFPVLRRITGPETAKSE